MHVDQRLDRGKHAVVEKKFISIQNMILTLNENKTERLSFQNSLQTLMNIKAILFHVISVLGADLKDYLMSSVACL